MRNYKRNQRDSILLAPINFANPRNQLAKLVNVVTSLRRSQSDQSKLDEIVAHASKSLPATASGIILAIPDDRWKELSIFVGLEVWGGVHPRWELFAPQSKDLIGKPQTFPPDKLQDIESTQCAQSQIRENQTGSILCIPVRCEMISEEGTKPIQKGEFELNLYAILWLIITHWSELSKRHCMKIACLGTRYGSDKLIPVIGHDHGKRFIHMKAPESDFRGCIRVIGINPYKEA